MAAATAAALIAAAGIVGSTASASAAPVAVRAAASAVATQPYTWKNVQIGGGGFVPGVVFSRAAKDVAYLRTDIGGAYRWDAATKRWTPMLDFVGWDNWGYNGVLSIAADPVDPDKVYAAVGMYTNSWDPNNGAVLRSSDRGKTWAVSKLPFKMGGNEPGRGMGERLVVDPNKNSIVYLGASGGNGLWRSTDSGITWAKVTGLTNTGDYVDDPTDTTGYSSDKQGVVWETFDPRSSTSGTATKTIYAGVADKDHPVYESTDAGATWAPVAGAPTGFLAHKGVLDETTGDLFIATSDTPGPYTGSHGDVWRLDTATGTWTQVSPVPSTTNSYGYSGLTLDRQKPGTLMVTAYSSWWPDTQIFRSTDSGATWTKAWDWTSYPNRSFRYKQDISATPWLTFNGNPSPPEVSPKLGWMTESLEIDPFDSDRMVYGTGATLYGSDNLTNWDKGTQIDIGVRALGIEETAVLDLISPPTGAPLISALGDIDGFVHTDLTKVPDTMFKGITYTSSTSLDYAETNPSILVRSGNANKSSTPNLNRAAFSTDGGANWFQASAEPNGVTGGGTIAAAADGSRFVWAPAGTQPAYSVGFGNSWTVSSGLPNGAVVESDRVSPTTFYGFAAGTFYVSKDGGATFTASAATGLPPGSARFKAVPGRTGDIWLAGGSGTAYGLWHSTDFGATFTKISGVDEADTIGFGKAAPGAGYQALYTSAKIGGVRGIFRSDDAGATWVRINDDAHQYGITNQTITGDPRIYGRVYLATNGRGIIYGDSNGTTSTPPVTSTPPPSTSAPASPTATATTPVPTTPPASPPATTQPATTRPATTPPATTPPTTTQPGPANNGCTATFKVDNSWGSGFQGSVTVTAASAAIKSWSTGFTLPSGVSVAQAWNGKLSASGSSVTVANAAWNGSLSAGASAAYGFIGSGTAPTGTVPVTCTAA